MPETSHAFGANGELSRGAALALAAYDTQLGGMEADIAELGAVIDRAIIWNALSSGADLNTQPRNTVAETSGGTVNGPAGFGIGAVTTYGIVGGSDTYLLQTAYGNTGRIWSRYKSTTWGAWTEIGVAPTSTILTGSLGALDLDTVAMNTRYVTAGAGATWATQHLPANIAGVIETFPVIPGSVTNGVQRITTQEATPRIFVRQKSASVWGAWVQIGAAPTATILTGSLGALDLDTLAMNTRYVTAGTGTWATQHLPDNVAGVIDTVPVVPGSTAHGIQTLTTQEPTPRIFVRRKSASVWGAWVQIGPVDTSTFATLSSVISTDRPGSGYKAIRCPITLGHNPAGLTATNGGAARLPINWAHTPTRIRPRVADIDIRSGTYGTATGVAITGVYVAAYDDATGAVSSVTQISSGGAVPTGGEWIGSWAPMPTAITGPWALIYSWTGTPTYVQRGYGHLHTDPAQAAGTSSVGWTTTATAVPMAVTLDVEIPAGVPVIMYVGDSLVCGQGAARGAYDAWSQVHARAALTVPILAASAGDTVVGMSSTSAYKWARFTGSANPDAIVFEPGVNDISAGTTAAALATLSGTLVAWLQARFTPAVHVTTITPNSTFDATKTAARSSYNATLLSLPWGVRDAYDTNAAVSTGSTLTPAYDSGDGLHFSTAGHAAYAAAISRPVTTRPIAYT